MTDTPIDDSQLVGGSPQDRRRLLERLHEYLDINARFDWEPLQDLWSGKPETVFFNLNGHTYNGRAHWTRLWQFYQNFFFQAEDGIRDFHVTGVQTCALPI